MDQVAVHIQEDKFLLCRMRSTGACTCADSNGTCRKLACVFRYLLSWDWVNMINELRSENEELKSTAAGLRYLLSGSTPARPLGNAIYSTTPVSTRREQHDG
jgi:hypothetical protein